MLCRARISRLVRTVVPSISTPGSDRASNRRQHRVGGFEFGGLSVSPRKCAPVRNASPAGDGVDLVLFEESGDAAGVLFDDLVFAGEHRRPVHLDVFHLKAKFGGALEIVVQIGMMQKDLGRDAADVKAGAAQKRIFLDDRSFQSPLRGANRGHITAGSAANDHKVVFCQSRFPFRLRFLNGARTAWMEG